MINNNGLTDLMVIENRKKYGENIFTKKKQDSFFKLLLETFSDPIIKILLIALGIKIIFLIRDFDWYETVGIVIAILVASLISSLSEYGSMKAFNKLTEVSSKINVKVKRNGNLTTIPINEVVVDDIVKLSAGDKIPADGIIISGKISVDESIMTGENKEIYKESGTNNSMVYMGTIVYSGDAFMLVRSVGDKTIYGKMNLELQETNVETPLKLRLTKLAQGISKLGYIASCIAGFSYLFYMIVIKNNFDINLISSTFSNGRLLFGYILDALTLCVTIIVVSVPEGLPMMITLVLSSNMKRMLKDNVLVRKLVGIETAGNINVLLTDKTGTITEGKLSVVGLLDGNGNNVDYIKLNNKYKKMIDMSLFINNDCSYDIINNKIVGGNITDRAIFEFIGNKNINYEIIKKESFSSDKKYSMVKVKSNGITYNLVKGAYEVIKNKCNSYYLSDGSKHLIKNSELDNIIKKISLNMNRVIAIAINENRETINNMTLLGFVILKDRVRNQVKDSIELVNRAYIQTIMITGDNKETAMSIARDINLFNRNDLVLTSEEFNKMNDCEIRDIFPKIKVIARAMPKDKSRLVDIAQSMDLIVGMTGDGVNDALALKRANVGFSMGSGTEVAKEASDIVILDDNFSSIVNAILYGRTIFKSIRKFLICQLTINLCSLLVSIIGPFIGIPVPITVIQMLWINMIMDTLSGFAFSYEPALNEYMEEKPKDKNEGIINKYMANQILVTGVSSAIISLIFLKSKFTNTIFSDDLMTAFFGLIIFISVFNSFSARTYRLNILANITKNKVFIGVIMFVVMMQIFLLYKGGALFRTNGLQINEFFIMFLISLLILPIDFIRKIILKKKGYKLGV